MFKMTATRSVLFAMFCGLFVSQQSALADNALAERFPNTPTVATASLPPLGNIPTFFVNLDPITMMTYLRMDREDGRRHFDKSKPSLLDSHIIRMENAPVGGSSPNRFSQGNTTICATVVTAYIPSWNDPASPPAAYNTPANATRTCSFTPSPPVVRNSTAETSIFDAFNVAVHFNSTQKMKVLMTKGQTPSSPSANPEPNAGWGFAIYDTNGTGGRLQEVVFVNANYVMN